MTGKADGQIDRQRVRQTDQHTGVDLSKLLGANQNNYLGKRW